MSNFQWLVSLFALSLTGATAGTPVTCPTDGKWDKQADFPWTCRYRDDNRRLIETKAPVKVVFMGDSITEGWLRADPAFFAAGWIDRGIGGQTTPQMVQRFRQDVLALKPRIVHIMAGTNDIAGNTGAITLAQTEANIRSMAEAARGAGIRVVIGSVLPARAFAWRKESRPAPAIIELNRWLRDYARSRGFTYADYHSAMAESDGGLPLSLSTDGVHPNKTGYAVMDPIAAKAIRAAGTSRRR